MSTRVRRHFAVLNENAQKFAVIVICNMNMMIYRSKSYMNQCTAQVQPVPGRVKERLGLGLP